jgi:hypothetical protein
LRGLLRFVAVLFALLAVVVLGLVAAAVAFLLP